MKATLKIVLGAASFVPIVYFALFVFWVVPAFFVPWSEGTQSLFSQRIDALHPLALAGASTIVLHIGLYAILLYRRSDILTIEKFAVPLIILASNGIILPFVWWLYIWRELSLNSLSRRRLTSRSS